MSCSANATKGSPATARRTTEAAVLLLLAAACGGAQHAPVGVATDDVPPRGALDFTLVTPAGDYVDVAELRGHPVLLFLFATFDGQSQAVLRELRRFTASHPDVVVLGIAVQPEPRQLLDAWQAALEPPFVVAYDPDGRVLGGTSGLGPIEAVPTFVMLDRQGIESSRRDGYQSATHLDEMLDGAL
jgi:hypothetical protein